MLNGIKVYSEDQLFDFTCEKTCWGSCCTQIPITAWDIIVLKRHFNQTTSQFLKEHTMLSIKTCPPRIMLKHHPNTIAWKFGGQKDRCHLLSTDRTCSVYEARPVACRNYPLARIHYPLNTQPDEYFKLKCPHIHATTTPTAKPAKEFLVGVDKSEHFTTLTNSIPKERFTKEIGFVQTFLKTTYDWDTLPHPMFTSPEEEFQWVLKELSLLC